MDSRSLLPFDLDEFIRSRVEEYITEAFFEMGKIARNNVDGEVKASEHRPISRTSSQQKSKQRRPKQKRPNHQTLQHVQPIHEDEGYEADSESIQYTLPEIDFVIKIEEKRLFHVEQQDLENRLVPLSDLVQTHRTTQSVQSPLPSPPLSPARVKSISAEIVEEEENTFEGAHRTWLRNFLSKPANRKAMEISDVPYYKHTLPYAPEFEHPQYCINRKAAKIFDLNVDGKSFRNPFLEKLATRNEEVQKVSFAPEEVEVGILDLHLEEEGGLAWVGEVATGSHDRSQLNRQSIFEVDMEVDILDFLDEIEDELFPAPEENKSYFFMEPLRPTIYRQPNTRFVEVGDVFFEDFNGVHYSNEGSEEEMLLDEDEETEEEEDEDSLTDSFYFEHSNRIINWVRDLAIAEQAGDFTSRWSFSSSESDYSRGSSISGTSSSALSESPVVYSPMENPFTVVEEVGSEKRFGGMLREVLDDLVFFVSTMNFLDGFGFEGLMG